MKHWLRAVNFDPNKAQISLLLRIWTVNVFGILQGNKWADIYQIDMKIWGANFCNRHNKQAKFMDLELGIMVRVTLRIFLKVYMLLGYYRVKEWKRTKKIIITPKRDFIMPRFSVLKIIFWKSFWLVGVARGFKLEWHNFWRKALTEHKAFLPRLIFLFLTIHSKVVM